MKILIIEDDKLIANIYRNKFSRYDSRPKPAPDGDIGLDLVRSFRRDAVSWSGAPRVTGLEVMRKLAQNLNSRTCRSSFFPTRISPT